jgi:hypothetical protein
LHRQPAAFLETHPRGLASGLAHKDH